MRIAFSLLLVLISACSTEAFQPAIQSRAGFIAAQLLRQESLLYSSSSAISTSTSEGNSSNPFLSSALPNGALTTPPQSKEDDRRAQVRQEGGRFAFTTKFGALNPFAIYYGLTSIILGIPWYCAMTCMQLFYMITFNKIDRQRRIPVFLNHVWGVSLMTLTNCWPKFENVDTLRDFYAQKRPAMFVANHNSWMDIPFLGASVGWRNYKIIAKKELYKVPILGKAIKVAGNVMVDRTDRKSQLNTLKTGMNYLKDGVHLCTFPEGTRSRSGTLMPFKNGAFKMAFKTGAPVVPISIVGAAKVHPAHWMFPMRPAHKVARVVVHPAVETEGKTEEELARAVRAAMISGLPNEQRPEN